MVVYGREAKTSGKSNYNSQQLDELGGLNGKDEVIEFDIKPTELIKNEFDDVVLPNPTDMSGRNVKRFPVPKE